MKFGYLSFNHAEGIDPATLAKELEASGFESFLLPEHTHIPASRATPFPVPGGELPPAYYRIMDPMVSLMAAAGVTSTLKLSTGICLLLQHDVLDLAKTTATLDVLSGGRFTLGVGVGWNEEELANHRRDLEFKQRYSAMRERVAALRTAWSEEVASFEGKWDNFEPSYIYPKPINGTIPISLGNAGPLGIRHAAEYADEWAPIDAGMLNVDGRPNVPGAIELFRQLATDAGRDPDTIPITIHAGGFSEKRFESYRELGVERLVLFPPKPSILAAEDTLRHVEKLAEFIDRFNS
jgi:probable F420-dependent oxidoreductase